MTLVNYIRKRTYRRRRVGTPAQHTMTLSHVIAFIRYRCQKAVAGVGHVQIACLDHAGKNRVRYHIPQKIVGESATRSGLNSQGWGLICDGSSRGVMFSVVSREQGD
jgi:hypothetical protein